MQVNLIHKLKLFISELFEIQKQIQTNILYNILFI